MASKKELKPCPFCGSEDVWVYDFSEEASPDKSYVVECAECGMMFIPKGSEWREVTLNAWNRRPGEKFERVQLGSCPACGHEASVCEGKDGKFRVVCSACRLKTDGMNTAENAIEEWKENRFVNMTVTVKSEEAQGNAG